MLILVMGCGGCGQQRSPADESDGRQALLIALDAWKAGDEPDNLAQRTPPIHVKDGDWKSGLRLKDYKADDAGKLVGSDINFNVALELTTAKGVLVKRDAVYAITTHPQVLVVRQDRL
jgi:hypothetical protein